MNSTKLIHTSEASVTTVTVDIQVVRIGAKQMTLAVFRQLPERDIFGNDGELIAPAWGWVNYDRQGYTTPFVFSCDGILWRTDINIHEADWGPHVEQDPIARQLRNDGWRFNWERLIDTRTAGSYLRLLTFASKEEAEEYLQRWRQSMMELNTVPQLFIGV